MVEVDNPKIKKISQIPWCKHVDQVIVSMMEEDKGKQKGYYKQVQ